MSSVMLTVIVGAPVLVAWLAVCAPWYLSRHRARRRLLRDESNWGRVSAGLSDVDADLDRAWDTERDRIRRRPRP